MVHTIFGAYANVANMTHLSLGNMVDGIRDRVHDNDNEQGYDGD